MRNEDGLAYGLAMIVLFLIAAPIIILAWSEAVNIMLVNAINPAIHSGHMSMQTRNGIAFVVDILRYGVPAVLIAAVAYSVNQANVKRSGG